jgi:nucleoside-diphosphate-sugar epimerase
MKKLVLIGASGFIGTRLIDLIGSENCQNIDKSSSSKYDGITTIFDVRNSHLKNILPVGAETIVLLAAEHRDDVTPISLYFDVNVNGTRNVLEAMDKTGIQKIIFTSSAAVYGLNKDNPDEKYPTEPTSHYGKSKKQAEELLINWQSKDPEKRSLTIVRSAVVFGENNRGNVYNLLHQISKGRFIMIGNGHNKKSMAYVGNIAEFIRYCIETNRPGCRIINYADKPDLTMNELITQAERSLNKKLPAVRLPYWFGRAGGFGFDVLSAVTNIKFPITGDRIKKFCASTQLDATLVQSCDFKSPYTLAEGLDRTLKSEFGK